jgi:prephenate dehydrogenase
MKNPLVIGYKGEIGSFMLNGLLRVMPKALDIWCVDVRETEEEVKDRIGKSDVIFLCVPLNVTMNWLESHKEMLQGKVIVEQCSLKEDIGIFEDLDIRSMHILFRPSGTPNLDDRRVGLLRKQFDGNFAKDIADITQSKIVWYDNVEEHDKDMAVSQALVHRTLLLLGKQLSICKGSTYISKKVIELTERIKKGDLELYSSIQDNKHLHGHLEDFKLELEDFDISKHMGV